MANKRQLKKRISRVCGDLAADLLLASYLFDGVDREKVSNIINEIASLQEDSLAKASFSFDKVVRDYDTRSDYRTARRIYNAKAFAQLRKEFGERAMAIVKLMNEAVPADVRKMLTPES